MRSRFKLGLANLNSQFGNEIAFRILKSPIVPSSLFTWKEFLLSKHFPTAEYLISQDLYDFLQFSVNDKGLLEDIIQDMKALISKTPPFVDETVDLIVGR